MKYLFALILFGLVAWSVTIHWNRAGDESLVPVIHWVTDPNPARFQQIDLFHDWQIANGHVVEMTLDSAEDVRRFASRGISPAMRSAILRNNPGSDAVVSGATSEIQFPLVLRLPRTELRLDFSNTEQTKKIIHGVSGVAGDIMDMNPGMQIPFFEQIGLLRDVGDDARRLGFSPEKTFAPYRNEIVIRSSDGVERQRGFPCNVSAFLYFVNVDVFERYGIEVPPSQWTLRDFERLGSELVAKANPPGTSPGDRVFFADYIPIRSMRRSMGVDEFNETLTASALDNPRYADALSRLKRWMDAKIIPSEADRRAFVIQAGYGGIDPGLFNRGQYAISLQGRHIWIEFRQFNRQRATRGEKPMRLKLIEPPHEAGGFRNTTMQARTATVYSASRHPELAALFLSFLASEAYNRQLVESADAIPPVPAFCATDEFRNPPGRPEEHGLHEPFAIAAESLAVPYAYSPFISFTRSDAIESEIRDAYLNGRIATAEEAARLTASRVNREIAGRLEQDRALKARYQELLDIQQQIDQRRAAGKRIPRAWILNPYHRAYYEFRGMLE